MVFRVKVCGITRAEDAAAAAQAGADAVGLNFYPGSRRCVDWEQAVLIRRACPEPLCVVGVYVNAPVDLVVRCAQQLPLHAVQLHGDEPPEYLRRLRARLPSGVGVIRAFRPRGALEPVLEYLRCCRARSVPLEMVLFDAPAARGAYGGTGTLGCWELAAEFAEMPGQPPLVLAGGLNPANVADAVAVVAPAAVDTASGVEKAPGVKDAEKIRRFVQAAHRIWQRLQAEGGP